jgi:hypothetical protein
MRDQFSPACARVVPDQNAVLFAVATNFADAQQALEDHAHFLLRRPIEASAIRQTLDVAYDLMLGERRRNFRNAVEIPVLLTIIHSGTSIECSTINIGSNGMAVPTPVPFNLAGHWMLQCFYRKAPPFAPPAS